MKNLTEVNVAKSLQESLLMRLPPLSAFNMIAPNYGLGPRPIAPVVRTIPLVRPVPLRPGS